MEKFLNFTSTAVPVPMEDIDTDQIIPARFLKATTREGFGENLFRDWRYDEQGDPKPDFILNDPAYGGKILVGGKNFGCGSSREHAAWAIHDHGFKAVISSFFADIFKNNALNNGLLPIQVSEEFLTKVFDAIDADAGAKFSIDLDKQLLTIEGSGESTTFEINSFKKNCLKEGLDNIDYLVSSRERIASFEAGHKIY